MSFLEPRVSFSSNFASLFSAMRQRFCTFSSKYLYALDKQIQSKCKFSDFQLLAWKLTKFRMSFFKPHFSFCLNFSTPFSVKTQFLWNVLTETVYALEKNSPSMYNFQTFGCSNESSPNSSCHFWNHKVRVYSNFASVFSVMKDNSSVLFSSTSYLSEFFRLLSGLVKIHQISHVIFETTSQSFFKLCITCQCHGR